VERGEDTDGALRVPVSDIAEKFICYYWRQVLPYVATRRPTEIAAGPIIADSGVAYGGVLNQITQANAVILEAVRNAHVRSGGSLAVARSNPRSWRALVTKIGKTVREMPLWKLQTIAGQDDEFLYSNRRGEAADHIELHPGVMLTLRRFHGLIQELVRAAWLRFVRGLRTNRPILGESEDLYEFLFGSERASLEPHAEVLREVQRGACFYCSGVLSAEKGHVDHFVPWSRYPLDLAHNFVLAHATCNDSKSSLLASIEHLERWCLRNTERDGVLADGFSARRLVHDLAASRAITRWAYELAEQSGSKVWQSRRARVVDLDPSWRLLLAGP
jgi:hypothetical protein